MTAIAYSFTDAAQIGLFGTAADTERVTAPLTIAHRTALIDVAAAATDTGGPDGWIAESLTLDDGMLVWDTGIGIRLTFAAVKGHDGMYVQVLTGSDRQHLTAHADWPIALEFPRETARTLWHLIGIFTI